MKNNQVYISRRSFLKASAFAAAAATVNVTAFAASAEDENCFAKITALRNTTYGPVQGLDQGESLVWYGIPYGAAPVGDLRWQAPQDPSSWTAAKDCTQVSEVAYQYSSGPIGTEDCLKLDVYTTPNAHKLPVLVFIHGGNNQTGNTKEIIGTELVVRDNCVYVTLDYRLGLFGFNCLPALHPGTDDTGNFTLLDIAKALDWVQENIAQFGGDPNNVTISGFSAGGRDVMAMLVSPMFAGRFQKAVAFSGGMTIANEAASESQIAEAIAPLAVEDGLFADKAAAKAWLLTDGEDVRAWLYGLDSARLCPLMSNAGIRMSVFPHLYGDGVVLPKNGFNGASYNSVPLLMLTGSSEFSMFAVGDSYFKSDEMSGYSAAEVQAAKDFAVNYGSDMYRIFNAECSAEAMFDSYDSDIYLCQINYGADDALTQIPVYGAFHGIFVPLLATKNNYSALIDFSGAGYQEMAVIFNRYLKNFLYYGDPNGDSSLIGSVKKLFSKEEELTEWQSWTPDNKVSMVMDASATTAEIECKDVSTTYEAIMDRMDADTTVSAELKQKMIRNVMNGRWFSDALDARYGNPTLWK